MARLRVCRMDCYCGTIVALVEKKTFGFGPTPKTNSRKTLRTDTAILIHNAARRNAMQC